MGKYNISELLSQNISPMMRKYLELKSENMDKIIFYRLGDFYEMFFDDAILVSKELEITLTGKDCGLKERAPMCGIPYHALDNYLPKLVEKGYKVAICEQTEDPKYAKGLVKREIVRIVTPGTVIEENSLKDDKNNFLCSVYGDGDAIGLVFVDISTGEINVINPITDKEYIEKSIIEILKYNPKEIIVNDSLNNNDKFIKEINKRILLLINTVGDNEYEYDKAIDYLKLKFTDEEILNSELDKKKHSAFAMYMAIKYLEETQMNELKHINSFDCYNDYEFAYVDISTKRNLELTETLREKKKNGSLMGVLDKTSTSMGTRLLRHYIEMPLKSHAHIIKRHDAVEELLEKTEVRNSLCELMDKIYDIERLCTKISYRNANGRDLVCLRESLKTIPKIKEKIDLLKSPLLKEINNNLNAMEDVVSLLESALLDEQPITVKEGKIIKPGYNAHLDELTNATVEGKNWIFQIEAEEKEKTGIKNLRINYNKVFGYYIEVTKSNISMVPDYFIRKQTLANCERYITEKLKQVENIVLGAGEKSVNLEYELFCEIREKIYKLLPVLQNTAKSIAKLDVLCSFANVAYKNHFVKPKLSTDGTIIIKDGRHPVVEQMTKDRAFIPNDTYLNNSDNSFAIITGPNMAGKSTYMRQVALIVIMSQIGSFVPAKMATLPVVDKIFTRVGASDDLASGQSTFMVEMNEVSHILKNATKDSLVILDEIGRGTSTFDGLSIAWSVVEYILKNKGSKTLFATHYHELTILEEKLKGVKNYQIAVKKRGDDITFLRKIIEGGTDDSFGIEVAKLAGLPNDVIKRAKEIVKFLESKNLDIDKIELKSIPEPKKEDKEQIGFESIVDNSVIDLLKSIDVTTLTPVEALNILYDLSRQVKR